MNKYRQLVRKLSAIALVSILTLAMAQPVYSFAQDEGTVTAGTEKKTSGESEADAADKEPEVSEDSPAKQDENSLKDANNEADSDNVISGNVSENQSDLPVSEVVEEKDNSSGKDNAVAGKTGQPALEQTAGAKTDVTKPVIEKVEFPQNGKTLKEGDTVEVYVYAYDADSGIKAVKASLSSDNSGYFNGDRELTYDEARGCYVGTWKLENTIAGKIYISTIKVVDKNDNYANIEVYENGVYGQYKYWFMIEKEDEAVKVANFHFPLNGKTVTRDDITSLAEDMKVELESAVKDKRIWAHFAANDGSYIDFMMERDESGKIFIWGHSSSESAGSGAKGKEYVLNYFYAERFGGIYKFQMSDTGNYKFTVQGQANDDETAPVITSIELDKNRQTLRAGDKVNITVKATDDKGLEDYGYAYFAAAADIDSNWDSVKLSYSQEDDAYHGVFDVTEDRYPCEWYLSSLDIYDKADNRADISKFNSAFYQTYPYYFNVYSGDTFVSPVHSTNVNFLTKNQQGSWMPTTILKKENTGRRTTLKEMGIAFPEMKSALDGLTQIGWMDGNGNPVTEDTELLNDGYISIYALYDKNSASASYSYIDQDGNWQYERKAVIFERGRTYRELFDIMRAYMPANMNTQYTFEKWEVAVPDISEDSVIPDVMPYGGFSLTAKFSGVKLLQLGKNYYDVQGCVGSSNNFETLIIDENMTAKELLDMLNGRKVPEMYKGLRFKGWSYSIDNDTVLENGRYVFMAAEYENCMIRYCIDPIFENDSAAGNWDDHNFEAVICQLAEVGDKVTVPKSFDGYESVTWRYRPIDTDTFTVKRNMEFFGYGSKSSGEQPNEPEEPVQPDKPVTPDTPEQGSKLPDSTVESIVEIIKEVKAGETVQVDMGDATVVPREILEAAKGKDVNVTLNMGGYSWTINGQDIMASNLNDINLEVKFDTNQIPNKVVSELAGGNPTKQISLTHNGDFGFKATLTMNVGNEHADKYGNLYYYDSDGKMVFMNAGKINKDGTVSLQFSHASDYLLVMSEQQMSQNDVPGTLQPKTANATDAKKSNSVKTGDNLPVIPLIAVMAAALIVIVSIRIKNKNRQ